MAVDKKGATDLANTVGALPTNKAVLAAAKDPFTRFFAKVAAKPQVPLLDSIVPLKVALQYYVQLQAAFAGKVSALQAMQKFRVVALISICGRGGMLLVMVLLLHKAGIRGIADSRLFYGVIPMLFYIPLLREIHARENAEKCGRFALAGQEGSLL